MKKQDVLQYLDGKDYLVLYFYPKDDTPGCTVEAKDFSCLQGEFSALGVAILGCSKDDEASHNKFVAKHQLNLTLISDEDLSLHKELGTWGEKKNYGNTYLGVIRSTFLLDKDGNIVKEWRNVRAKGHAQRVLDYVKIII
ncbi:MAG: peroxiredoxin [candidate division SR1 bacterium]|nr:MAG: peroxiredoxin [candidate division SR1 bacterium]